MTPSAGRAHFRSYEAMSTTGKHKIIAVPPDALVILCGPAASGKSLFARRNARATQVVSSDRCRALVCDDPSDQRFSPCAFDLFHRTIAHRLAIGRLTLADSTAISPDARRELRRLARRAGRPAVLICFDVPLSACLRNNAARRRRVPVDVLRAQHARYRDQRRRFGAEGYAAIARLAPSDVVTARLRPQKERAPR